MKLLSKNQAVGDGCGWMKLRDLYDTDGTMRGRVSIAKTVDIECEKVRDWTTEKILEKYGLKG
jgi:hypothetical protein